MDVAATLGSPSVPRHGLDACRGSRSASLDADQFKCKDLGPGRGYRQALLGPEAARSSDPAHGPHGVDMTPVVENASVDTDSARTVPLRGSSLGPSSNLTRDGSGPNTPWDVEVRGLFGGVRRNSPDFTPRCTSKSDPIPLAKGAKCSSRGAEIYEVAAGRFAPRKG
jgi:hypothetical protein